MLPRGATRPTASYRGCTVLDTALDRNVSDGVVNVGNVANVANVDLLKRGHIGFCRAFLRVFLCVINSNLIGVLLIQ